jgi:hypothetical protein
MIWLIMIHCLFLASAILVRLPGIYGSHAQQRVDEAVFPDRQSAHTDAQKAA